MDDYLTGKGRRSGWWLALFGLILLLLGCVVSPAQAHKVHIFAYVDGELIKTESRFSGGRPARNCDVTVLAQVDRQVVANGRSNEEGLFHFATPGPVGNLEIVVACGDGHRGIWVLGQDEYQGDEEAVLPGHAAVVSEPSSSSAPSVDQDQFRKIVAEELEIKLAPLRRDLARLAERQTSLPDILGGIGYILGLAGLAAYMRYRKNR